MEKNIISVGALTTLTAVPIFKAVVNSGNQYDLGNYFFLALSSITLLHPIYILKVARKPESEGEVGDKLLKLWCEDFVMKLNFFVKKDFSLNKINCWYHMTRAAPLNKKIWTILLFTGFLVFFGTKLACKFNSKIDSQGIK